MPDLADAVTASVVGGQTHSAPMSTVLSAERASALEAARARLKGQEYYSALDVYVWQDREIRFDIPVALLELRTGEKIFGSMQGIEDTKGNNGEQGTLMVSNLRLLWAASKSPKTNITIGYNCMMNITIRTATSRLRGNTQALYILTKYNNTRFEFIFTNLVPHHASLFSLVQFLHRAYESSRLYRDLKLRGAIILNKQLILLLPDELIYNKISGVWNLSSDQGNLGVFFITNVRLVWHANLAENFNVSIPFLQMKSIRVRDSKFGLALVVETMPQAGSYVLGFKIDPPEKLTEAAQEIQNIHQVFSAAPIFGVHFNSEGSAPASNPVASSTVPVAIAEAEGAEEEEETDAFALYYADVRADGQDREPVFCGELGLAVETLRDGISIDALWSIV